MPPPRPPAPLDIPPTLFPSLTLIPPPDGPPSTTTILLLLHGLGDSPLPFASFARNLALPGVFSIAIRGPSPLPPSLLGLPLDAGPTANWHWGDDIILTGDGDLDPDPGFTKATDLVLRQVVDEVLVGRCGWERGDVMVFGYGQGGTVGLGVGVAAAEGGGEGGLKGVVSVGGGMVGSLMPREKGWRGGTPVMVCRGRGSEVDVEGVRGVFEGVEVVEWEREGDGMPRTEGEVRPLMRWFGERLRF